MARVDWLKIGPKIIFLLKGGKTVQEAASEVGISYSSVCKYLRDVSIDKQGNFKDRVKDTPRFQELFTEFILKEFNQISIIEEKMGLSPAQVQYYMKIYKKRRAWDFAKSSSINVKRGRKGELFIKEQEEFVILKDPIKKDSKSPYDLIIKGMGGVDVKVTHLRETESGTHRWKFNIANTKHKTKAQLKYLFLLGYTADYEKPMVLLIIPHKDVKGFSSLSVGMENLRESKYAKYVHKTYVEGL